MDPDKYHQEVEEYGDEGIKSLDSPVPRWLKINYFIWIVFGVIWFYLFWNGSTVSYFDRGYWFELQKAANTTMPFKSVDDMNPNSGEDVLRGKNL